MRGTIVIDENRCKGCELCVPVCPKGIIEIASYFTPRGYRPAALADPDGLCTGCLLCSTICPDVAITVYREDRKQKTELPPSQLPLPQGERRVSSSLQTAQGLLISEFCFLFLEF